MAICSSCGSYQDPGSVFCSRCGDRLAPGRARAGRGRIAAAIAWVSLAALVFLAVVLIVTGEDDPKPEGPRLGSRTSVARSRSEAPVGVSTPSTVAVEEPVAEELDPARVHAIARASLVILELRRDTLAPLRDVHGVLIDGSGVVLTRLRSLLGARSGRCRFSFSSEPVDIVGVIYYEAPRDLALVRIDASDLDRAVVEPMEESPARLLVADDVLWAFGGRRLNEARVSEPYLVTGDGTDVVRLAAEPVVAPESVMAVDTFGLLVGLCRPFVDGRPVDPDSVGGSDPYRVAVDPVATIARHRKLPVSWTLRQLTTQLYEGTFSDLADRGARAYRQRSWLEAIELLAGALDRVDLEGIEGEIVDRIADMLRESYLQEISSRQGAGRLADATSLAEAALDRLPADTALWSLLAKLHAAAGQLRESVGALIEVRRLEPGERTEIALESAYLEWGRDVLARGDDRMAESVYVDGLEQLDSSGKLHFELAKLYEAWQAWDDAIRLYRIARQLDRRLDDQISARLDRIDDILKQRDAIIVPIDPESSMIRANVVVDGARTFPFLIDTGATHTTLPKQFATQLGYDPEQGTPVRLRTAGGVINGWKIRLGSVSLEGYTVRSIDAIVLPDHVALGSGLLGLNWLKYFRYSVDGERGEFRLERR